MVVTLAMSGVAAGVICGAAVVVSLVLWLVLRPPWMTQTEMPPVLRRGLRWWLGLTLLFAAAGAGWVMLRRPLGLPRSGVYRFVPFMLGMMPILVVNPVYLWRTAWLRRAVKRADGRLCRHCAFELTGLPGAGVCPECGKGYEVEAERAMWLKVWNG